MKKKRSVVALSWFTVCGAMAAVACGDDDPKQSIPVNTAGMSGKAGSSSTAGNGGLPGKGGADGAGTSGADTSGGMSGAGTSGAGDAGAGGAGMGAGGAGAGGADTGGASMGGAGMSAGAGAGGANTGGASMGGAGAGGVGGFAGTGTAGGGMGGVAASSGSGGTGGTCDIPTIEVFQRSDTDASWDDDDFSSVVLNAAGACPRTLDVTWPHEADWEDADPSESNQERTHFTIDSYYSNDLSGKQINLTISLAADVRGPAATAGAYTVRLVSVSTFDRVVGGEGGMGGMGGEGGMGEGGMDGEAGADGNAGIGGMSGSAGSGAGGAGTAGGGAGGMAPVIETGYTEAISVGRGFLTRVGDTASFSFPLPAKTAEVDSYDPARVIKINVRVENEFEVPEEGPAPVYDYLTSQFVITNLTISDAQ